MVPRSRLAGAGFKPPQELIAGEDHVSADCPRLGDHVVGARLQTMCGDRGKMIALAHLDIAMVACGDHSAALAGDSKRLDRS